MLKDILKNKNVLFIPIYSMRSYETGLYNLAADGNMARIVSKLLEVNFSKATILYPSNSINFYEATKALKWKDNIEWIPCNAYGKNAKETRDNYEPFIDVLLEKGLLRNTDCIVCEPNYLLKWLISRSAYENELIYWCVASITSEVCPWFVEAYANLDKAIAKVVPTAVCTQTQVEALGNKAFIEPIYEPEYFDYDIIFFPFRLSDKSYRFEEFKNIVTQLYEELDLKGADTFKVFYTDPNESYKEKLDPNIFVKVPSDKPVYLSILKSKPIIPYFEDSRNMEHISINEFLYYNCRIIAFENKRFDNNKNVKQILSMYDLREAITDLLFKGV